MLAEIDRLLDGKSYNIIAIECEDQSSPAFLHMSIVGYAMKRNVKVIYLSTARNIQAFRIMASKQMIRLSEKLKFVPVCQCLPDAFITNDDSFYTSILEEIDKQIEENDKDVFIICDSLTAFCDLITSPSHVPAFLRRLQHLAFERNVEPKVVITLQSNDRISNILLHESDVILRIKRIGNGFAKDVTGQLYLMERNGEPSYAETVFNYHLSDRYIRLFLPGMSRPEL